MHCIYLGVVCWLFTELLFGAHLFPGAGGINSSKARFENAINSIQWPSDITRLPKNVRRLSPLTFLFYIDLYSSERTSPSRKLMNGGASSQ
jgi:hypothetical protein